MAVVRLTTGKQGDGKSWSITRRIVKEWLPNDENGVLWTNLPLRLDDWRDDAGTTWKGLIAYVAEQTKKPEEAVRARIRIIPDEEIQAWRRGESDPESYFNRIEEEEELEKHPLCNSHVVIDEAGKIWPAGGRKSPAEKTAVTKLAEFLATIRHDGATIEFVCQDSGQIDRSILKLCGEHLVMNNTAEEPEPFFGMKKGEWYQAYAALFRVYFTYIRCTRKVPEGEKLVDVETSVHWLDPFYFTFYDSFNRPGRSSGTRKRMDWERQSPPVFFFWWYLRNIFGLTKRAAQTALVVWLCFCGGGVFVMNYFQSEMKAITTGQTARAQAKQVEARPASSGQPTPAKKPTREDRLPYAKQLASDPQKVAYLMEQVDRYKEDRDRAMSRLQVLEKNLGDSGAVALIDDRGMALRTGEYYRVGDRILWGEYEGATVARVDRRRGMVVLSDDRVLRMQPPAPKPDPSAPAGPDVVDDSDRGPTPAIHRRLAPTPAVRTDRVANGSAAAGERVGQDDDPTVSVLDRSSLESR